MPADELSPSDPGSIARARLVNPFGVGLAALTSSAPGEREVAWRHSPPTKAPATREASFGSPQSLASNFAGRSTSPSVTPPGLLPSTPAQNAAQTVAIF